MANLYNLIKSSSKGCTSNQSTIHILCCHRAYLIATKVDLIKYAGELRLANVHSSCLLFFFTSLGYETYETKKSINKQTKIVLKDAFQMKTL